MENRRLHQVFDQVRLSPEREEAMLADLLGEQKASAGRKSRLNIPAAALTAAALAVVLAGTAVAVEYWGKVDFELIDDYSTRHRDGYSVYMPEGGVPVDSLSEEVLAACGDGGWDYFPFSSWTEAEVFLGLELADNAKLEEMYNSIVIYETKEGQKSYARCLVSIGCGEEGLPATISLTSSYDKENCHISQLVEISTDADPLCLERRAGIMVPREDSADFQEYMTPSGLEVTIYAETASDGFRGDYERTTYWAHFIQNSALFTVSLSSTSAWQVGRESRELLDPWETLLEVLDAYE